MPNFFLQTKKKEQRLKLMVDEDFFLSSQDFFLFALLRQKIKLSDTYNLFVSILTILMNEIKRFYYF